MEYIAVNDVFHELIDENKRLKQFLNVFIKYKNFVDLLFTKLKLNLDSNDSKTYKDLHQNVEEVFRAKELVQSLDNNNKSVDLKENKVKGNRKRGTKVAEVSQKYLDMSSDQAKVPWSRVNGIYVCGFIGCGKEYTLKTGLDYHLTTHRKRFVCDYEGCGYRTGVWKTFKCHMNVHKQVKPFECPFCEKTLSSKKTLENHIKTVHNCSKEPLICGIDNCYKEFDNQFRLNIHKNNKHLKEKRFSCHFPNCDFRSVSKTFLKIHLLSHSEERPFICQIEGCVMSFKTKSALNNHVLSHSSERNFKCSYDGCDKCFKSKVTLNRHIISIHSGIRHSCNWPGCEFETNCARTLNTHKIVHSTERNFHCEWPECGKSFKKKIDLTQHSRIHRNERRYACSWPGCSYRCVFGGNLSKHLKVHQK